MPLKPLQEFFAVTLSSVYRVNRERNENGGPTVQKIDGSVDGEVSIGGLLPAGKNDRVIITRSSKDPRRNRLHVCQPEDILPMYQIYLDFSVRTSSLVGLFLTMDAAANCFASENKQVYDERWNDYGVTTELVIGFNHPDFQVFDFDCQID